MSKAKKPIAIPVPEGADMRSEAAAVAAHPEFKRLVARGRQERAAGRQGRSHEEVWAELEQNQAAEGVAKVTVSLPAALVRYADERAAALHTTRSQVISRALEEQRTREKDELARRVCVLRDRIRGVCRVEHRGGLGSISRCRSDKARSTGWRWRK